jgi:hypothetical protein
MLSTALYSLLGSSTFRFDREGKVDGISLEKKFRSSAVG